eukprot:TRINITY_DN34354_c0_g2_i1.p1 TRINITY_DN34354_c0_g2~~TRINITY_DN34354_c0_g2_i1.p1  ORF type:complete len:336 (-),score=67.29 TRINITY_DN34354_c0_g2_i1:9-1016(-)
MWTSFAKRVELEPAILVLSRLTQEAFKRLPSMPALEWFGGPEAIVEFMDGLPEIVSRFGEVEFIALLEERQALEKLAEQCLENRMERLCDRFGPEFHEQVIEALQRRQEIQSWEDWLEHIDWTVEDCFGGKRFAELLLDSPVDWHDEVSEHLGNEHFFEYYRSHSKDDEVADDFEWCIKELKDAVGYKFLLDMAGIDIEQSREAVLESVDTFERMIATLGGWGEIADEYFDGVNDMLECLDDEWLHHAVSEDLETLVEMMGGLSALIDEYIGVDGFLDLVHGLEGLSEKFVEDDDWFAFVLERGGVDRLLLLLEEHVASREALVDDMLSTHWCKQ